MLQSFINASTVNVSSHFPSLDQLFEQIEAKPVIQSGNCFILLDPDLTALLQIIDPVLTLADIIREVIILIEEDMAKLKYGSLSLSSSSLHRH